MNIVDVEVLVNYVDLADLAALVDLLGLVVLASLGVFADRGPRLGDIGTECGGLVYLVNLVDFVDFVDFDSIDHEDPDDDHRDRDLNLDRYHSNHAAAVVIVTRVTIDERARVSTFDTCTSKSSKSSKDLRILKFVASRTFRLSAVSSNTIINLVLER